MLVLARIGLAWIIGLVTAARSWRRLGATAVLVCPAAAVCSHACLEETLCRGARRRTYALSGFAAAVALRYKSCLDALAQTINAILPQSDNLALLLLVLVGVGCFTAWLFLVNAQGGATAAIAAAILAAWLATHRATIIRGLVVALAVFLSSLYIAPLTNTLILRFRGPAWLEQCRWYQSELKLIHALAHGDGHGQHSEAHRALGRHSLESDTDRRTRAESPDSLLLDNRLRRPSIIAQYKPPRRASFRSARVWGI